MKTRRAERDNKQGGRNATAHCRVPVAPRTVKTATDPAAFLQKTIGNQGMGRLMRQSESGRQSKKDSPQLSSHIETAIRAMQAQGRPLDSATRSIMESRLGYDFSGVRVHADEKAAKTAEAVNARAFTLKNDVVFGSGQYALNTKEGQRLLAHELTHVVQQRAAGSIRANSVFRGALTPAFHNDTIIARKEKKEENKEQGFACGSPAWPWPLIDTLILKLPHRWSEAIKRAKRSKGNALFDLQLGRPLVYNQLMAFQNLLWAPVFMNLSAYHPDFSKGLEMSEHLSEVTDTYLNLVSLALHYDLKKYLEDDVSTILKANALWAFIYGMLLQGGLTGLNLALEQELNFTSLLKPAFKKYTEAPRYFGRPYVFGNLPDPRWTPPLWASPSGVEAKLSGIDEEESPYSLSMNLGLNLASIADLYPEKEEDKAKYRGFELYPYFSLRHQWPKEGGTEPATKDRWLAGVFFGTEGVYPLMELGQRIAPSGDVQENYLRLGLFLRDLGPLSLQLSCEHSARPESPELRTRLNAASTIRLIDNKFWQMTLGGMVGGLLPAGESAGAVDVGGQFGWYYKYNRTGSPEPFKTGFKFGATSRRQDPFDPSSPRLLSALGTLSIFDMLKLSLEYHRIAGNIKDSKLPKEDVRFMIYPGPGMLNF